MAEKQNMAEKDIVASIERFIELMRIKIEEADKALDTADNCKAAEVKYKTLYETLWLFEDIFL